MSPLDANRTIDLLKQGRQLVTQENGPDSVISERFEQLPDGRFRRSCTWISYDVMAGSGGLAEFYTEEQLRQYLAMDQNWVETTWR